MPSPLEEMLHNFSQRVVAYLPNLLAGFVLMAAGLLLGWILKRVIMQLCAAFRVHRAFLRFRWGEPLAKADVRYGLYTAIGNLVLTLVFLVFFNNALSVMNLTVLSAMMQAGILFLPRVFLSLLILGAGWMVSFGVASAVRKALLRERIPRAALIARMANAVSQLFFAAMALTELDIAREIVIVGFAAAIVTLGAISVVLTAKGGKAFTQKILEAVEEE
jgi:multidrug transporter EmrE-like cation transporter